MTIKKKVSFLLLKFLETDDNNTTLYQILDLDELGKQPLTHRHTDSEKHQIFDTAIKHDKRLDERVPYSPREKTQFKSLLRETKTSPAKSPKRSPQRLSNAIEREAYIMKWMDMSQKFGFLYKLSNG